MSSEESPGKVPDGQPDPVLVGPGMKTMSEGAYTKASNATPSMQCDKNHQTSSDAPSYFAEIPGNKGTSASAHVTSPATPIQAARDARSGPELLRRLSLMGSASPVLPEADPCQQHPDLGLSRRIISAAFCIPYKLHFRSGSDWVWFTFRYSLMLHGIVLELVNCAAH